MFLTCNGLSDTKEPLINSKIEKVLGVTYLSKILNWELAKEQTKRLKDKHHRLFLLTWNIITHRRPFLLHLLQETLHISFVLLLLYLVVTEKN